MGSNGLEEAGPSRIDCDDGTVEAVDIHPMSTAWSGIGSTGSISRCQ